MEQQQQSQQLPPNVGHPLLRSFLGLVAQVALPIAEQFLAAYLAKNGIILPLPGATNAHSNMSGPVGVPANGSNGHGSTGPVTQQAPPGS